jgi:7-cyano-7-deazaguanine synthase in queuosine biosynthesis
MEILMKKLLLLSGGMDSALCLARYGADLAVGFAYGQPHIIELDVASRVALHYGVQFETHTLPLMPRVNDVVFAGRNAVMLAAGAAIAQARGMSVVVIGRNVGIDSRWKTGAYPSHTKESRARVMRQRVEAFFGAQRWESEL